MKHNDLSQANTEDSAIIRESDSLINTLLKDHTTGSNIKWATDSYTNHGYLFSNNQEITVDLITGWYEGFIRPRAEKNAEVQLERQRNRAEVFTPSWVIKLQVEAALDEMKELSLTDFIQTKWLEITCGEAPYMVNRYDMNTGELIPLNKRVGFMDVKFKKLNEAIESEKEWVKLAIEIFKASYGYEYQGDSLLLARENLILTFIDNYFYMFGAFPNNELLLDVSKIISQNVFQMDGLTYEVPYSDGGEEVGTQLNLFDKVEVEEDSTPKLAKVKLWGQNKTVEFKTLTERDGAGMKFDVVLGNPPYQDEIKGTSAKQIYPEFMEAAYEIADKSILITPARFLFNAGKTPKAWNSKMLKDKYLKVLFYEPYSPNVFKNTDIKGGIAITYRDTNKELGPIDVFTAFEELNNILEKVWARNSNVLSFNTIAYMQNKFNLQALYKVYPNLKNKIGSKGTEKRLTTSIFSTVPEVFSDNKNSEANIGIVGLINNKRIIKYIDSSLLENQENLDKWKVFVPKSNGSGALGEVLSTPMIGQPMIGHTQTFISFGNFDTEAEALACLKYIKSKFLRVLLGALKVTQDNPPSTWAKVPVQDFTSDSDIDWSKSIAEIDQQLYEKYGLSQEEIDFIEINIKEME